MPADYGVLIVGTLAPFCAIARLPPAANDDIPRPEVSKEMGEPGESRPVWQTA